MLFRCFLDFVWDVWCSLVSFCFWCVGSCFFLVGVISGVVGVGVFW